MAIITLSEAAQLKEMKHLLRSTDAYEIYATRAGDLLVRPTVTSKGRDTYVLNNQNENIIKDIENWWGKHVLHIAAFSFRDDAAPA